MSESKTSVRRIEAVEKRRRALELRKAGATYATIAQTLGFASHAGAYKTVMIAFAEIKAEHVEEVRTLELLRLDQMLIAIWPKISEAGVTLADRVRAIDAVLRIMDRRAKMLGIDAPTRVDITDELRRMAHDAGLSDDDTELAVREAVIIAREHAGRA